MIAIYGNFRNCILKFRCADEIRNRHDKRNAWVAIMTSALIATNYTENGWGLTRAPDHITRRLQRRLNRTLLEEGIIDPSGKQTYKEHYIPVIGGEEHARPLMITNAHDNREILNEMTPFFEWWSGIDLKPSIAYGIRAYRNDSNLLMHIDKPTSHVISGIYHVGRSEDAEPWPIVIEDFHGEHRGGRRRARTIGPAGVGGSRYGPGPRGARSPRRRAAGAAGTQPRRWPGPP